MRTADDSVPYHDGAASLLLDELKDFAGDAGVMANVACVRLPAVNKSAARQCARVQFRDLQMRPPSTQPAVTRWSPDIVILPE
jgi:hypothetical protein